MSESEGTGAVCRIRKDWKAEQREGLDVDADAIWGRLAAKREILFSVGKPIDEVIERTNA